MADSPADQDLADRYRDYIAACNAHAFGQLATYVAPTLRVNGEPVTTAAYVADIARVVEAFPDYHWDLRHLVVNRPMVAAHLVDTGMHTGAPFLGVPVSGRAIVTRELAVYTWGGGVMQEVWVTSDRLGVLEQLRAAE